MSILKKLQARWKVGSVTQVLLILLTFACTGTTVVYISKPLLQMVFDGGPPPWWGRVLYYIVILPVYNVFLLAFGFLFGQFSFFWAFEKRLLSRITGGPKQQQ